MFHPIVERWFASRFAGPTEAQSLGWPEIQAGLDTLIMAPTGSGKTLAAFLAGLDQLVRRAIDGGDGALDDRIRIVYVSPLKALGADVDRNLQAPLAGIEAAAAELGRLMPPIRTAVRTGDTTPADRARILRRPPHVLITTPESLYLMVTSAGGRKVLGAVQTVIVDEIHALVGGKRGAHLSLTLERLDRLVAASSPGQSRPQRIGLSATVEPPAEAARFLTGCDDAGQARPCRLIDAGRAQEMDVAICVPKETLSAVASRKAWGDVYDQLVTLIGAHKTTLVFVPSRRLAERVAHDLEERMGPDQVSAHHGALSKRTRQLVERRLQTAQLKAVVATASLELGIDIGDVELVCQLGSPRSIAVLRQRIGRANHAVGAKPKGRLFALTRDDLIESAAGVRAMRRGRIDRPMMLDAPLDILAQQLVAACGAEELDLDALWALCKRAAPYSKEAFTRARFDAVVDMLGDGVATRRGQSGAHLHLDRVNGKVRARRGARLAALTSGGAIPDKADYTVVEDTTEQVVGTLDEDFAIESMAGDIFLLGSHSWRVRRVESGRVRVEDAAGLPPSVPFWNGEGLARSLELSEEMALLREQIWSRRPADPTDRVQRQATLDWLCNECSLDAAGAEQALDYVVEGGQALGAVPSQTQVVAERFFDEAGGMQLVVHAPFGARINRAWGHGLRKKFCRTFDFELQAVATDDAILLSLGPQHSFPLDAIFGFLHPLTLEETLTQAALQSPMFETRWRWNATRSLAVLRHTKGRRTPPELIRMRAADLLAAVFPDQAGCQDNHGGGPVEPPDHPLVDETLRDCLEEVMDTQGLLTVLGALRAGRITTVSRDTVAPSPFSHGILQANPYAFLDDAPLEERRTRAVSTARPGELAARDADLLRLDPHAIAQVVDEAQPEPRTPDELHDLLCTSGLHPENPPWSHFMDALCATGRATRLHRTPESSPPHAPDAAPHPPDAAPHPPDAAPGAPIWSPPSSQSSVLWVAAERCALAKVLFANAVMVPVLDSAVLATLAGGRVWDAAAAAATMVGGWLSAQAPASAARIATALGLALSDVEAALALLESDGLVMQGRFTDADDAIQWCDRRLLQRIHRLTLGRLREQIKPVPPSELMRFVLRWQHVQPGTRLHGPEGLLHVIEQLEGIELAPVAWEREVLPARIEGYQPAWLDELCLSGEVAWARLRVEPPEAENRERPRGQTGKIGLFLRAHAPWLVERDATPPSSWAHLSPLARRAAEVLEQKGAAFAAELSSALGEPAVVVEDALWELVRTGAVSSDGFSGLRALVAPREPRPRHPLQGRWSLLHRDAPLRGDEDGPFHDGSPVELAQLYLRRYGIVMREFLARETAAPPWRELVRVYRRLEARGEVRGGRFVSGPTGEQFALPEALVALRAIKRVHDSSEEVAVPATDPLNLVGILTPGPKVAAVPGHRVVYRDGAPLQAVRSLA